MAKRALLVGINRYSIPGAELRGCLNDVRGIRGVLTQFFDFSPNDIATLEDAQATTKNMRTQIANLVRKSKKGDVLFLHYSGHGSNVPDADGDEADERDEILCPADLDWKDTLSDDWLRTTFDGLASGVNLTVIFDCCHSGSATRFAVGDDEPIKPRYLASPWDLVATESKRQLTGKVRIGIGAPRSRRGNSGPRQSGGAVRTMDIVDARIPEILITGCRSDQTSADALIAGNYNGALTYHLIASLTEKQGKVSYRQLHGEAQQRIRQGRFTQVPQLEGTAAHFDRPFLEPF